MYRIYVDDALLYSPELVDDGYLVLNPKLTLELSKSGSLTFLLPPANPMYEGIQKLKSIITVYQNSEEIFRGRVLHDEKDFYNRKNVYCEGELAFLLDSQQRPYNFQGDIPELFAQFINSHNSQVEAAKQFNVGEITVTDPNNYINRSNIYYNNTWDEISDKLIASHGGYLRLRLSNGKRYIDYVKDYGKVNSQVIEFGVNMLDISEYITAEDVFTVLIPLGVELTDEEGNNTGRLTVESVNDGKDYIEDDAGIALFGRIVKTQEWDDVTVASNLLTKGRAFLNSGIEMAVTLTMKAIDLHLADVDVERIGLGDYVRVISLPHKLDKYFLCSKISIDMVSPDKTEYTFGVTYTTMTEKQVGNAKVIQTTVTSVQSALNDVNKVNNIVSDLPTDYVKKSLWDANISQEGIFKLLTNNGRIQGMILDEETGDIYINASYIRSGVLTIGGVNSEKSTLQILDSEGNVCVQAGTDGIKILKGEVNATSGSLDGVTIVEGITISSKTNDEMRNLSLVKIEETETGTGTAYCITFGELTGRSTPIAIEGSSITIHASSGITFSANNIIFENTIEAPTAYFDDLFVKNKISFEGSNDEKNVYFKTKDSTGTYQHNCRMYGGKAESATGIGWYDQTNARFIWSYNDQTNLIDSESELKSTELDVTISSGASAILNNSVYFPFLRMVVFQCRFTVNAITANTVTTLGTIDSGYAPNDAACGMAGYSPAGVYGAYITVDGYVRIKSPNAISSGQQLYISGCYRY